MSENTVLSTLENYARLKNESTAIANWLGAANAEYQNVFFPDGVVAFRFDARRGLVEVKRRGQCYYFDLARIAATRS